MLDVPAVPAYDMNDKQPGECEGIQQICIMILAARSRFRAL